MTYDVLGRMLTRTDDATGATPQVSTWVYDTAAKGIGKPGSVSGYGYAASIAYDALGRPAQKTETIDGATYGVSNTYDGSGRVATTAYPTGLTIQSVYTAFGHLSELRNAFSGVSYWRATSADARGNVTGAALGNGVSEVRSFDATTGHLSTIGSSSAAAGAIQNLAYSFDTVGNLLSRTDAKQAIAETFQYDAPEPGDGVPR